jgi:hypothetical protein
VVVVGPRRRPAPPPCCWHACSPENVGEYRRSTRVVLGPAGLMNQVFVPAECMDLSEMVISRSTVLVRPTWYAGPGCPSQYNFAHSNALAVLLLLPLRHESRHRTAAPRRATEPARSGGRRKPKAIECTPPAAAAAFLSPVKSEPNHH